MPTIEKAAGHPHISIDSAGRPVVSGTRITVMDIALRYEFMGQSADAIIDESPHLRLEQVHDALSYYYGHKAELDRKSQGDESFLRKLKKSYPSKLKVKLG